MYNTYVSDVKKKEKFYPFKIQKKKKEKMWYIYPMEYYWP